MRIYVKNWISCPSAVTVSLNDLILPKDLLAYGSVHQGVGKAVSTKLAGHLWYLSEELVALSSFDPRV